MQGHRQAMARGAAANTGRKFREPYGCPRTDRQQHLHKTFPPCHPVNLANGQIGKLGGDDDDARNRESAAIHSAAIHSLTAEA